MSLSVSSRRRPGSMLRIKSPSFLQQSSILSLGVHIIISMYTSSSAYRVVRETNLAYSHPGLSDGEFHVVPSYTPEIRSSRVIWEGGHYPSQGVMDKIMQDVAAQGSPRKRTPDSRVKSDKVRIQTRRTIASLGWRTVHTNVIEWVRTPKPYS